MSFLTVHGGSFYYKIQKVNISTRDKTDASASDLAYEVALPTALRDVVSITLVDYSFPSPLFPSFQVNTDTLDFSLQNPSINGGVATVFSITLPRIQMVLESKKNKGVSLVDALETKMMNIIDADPVWLNQIEIEVFPGELFQLLFSVQTRYFVSDSTVLTFLFNSGPNQDKSMFASLGFPTQTDVSSTTVLTLDTPVQIIESPLQTSLFPSKYADVFIDEIGSLPIKRIFVNDETYVTNTLSNENIASLDVITNNPPRNIDKLHVRIVHDSELVDKTLPHSFTLHVVSLDNGILPTPSYVAQRLSY